MEGFLSLSPFLHEKDGVTLFLRQKTPSVPRADPAPSPQHPKPHTLDALGDLKDMVNSFRRVL
jgi:hypothetical protein